MLNTTASWKQGIWETQMEFHEQQTSKVRKRAAWQEPDGPASIPTSASV